MDKSNNKSRFLYIDNLRLFMIILVVMVHLAVTYSGIGSWYLMDNSELGAESLVFFGLFQSFTQAYFMGFLFLISGYFIARSYDKKGYKVFLKERFIRLGIPTLIYMLIIHPFIVYFIMGKRWVRPSFVEYYSNHLLSLDFVGESGPLWFAFALLIFNIIYAIYRRITIHKNIYKEKKLPGIKHTIFIIFLITFIAFLIRLGQPIDSSIINMQLCFFAQYIILFMIGIKAGKYDWFSTLSFAYGIKWLKAALIPGILSWVILMLAGGALDGGFDLYKGGLYWQSAVYALWESFIAVSMSIGLIALFKEKFNKQSKLIKIMSDNSFAVYMFHAPIIIAVSLAMINLHIHPILKFILACFIGLPLSFMLCNFIFKRIPFLKKVL